MSDHNAAVPDGASLLALLKSRYPHGPECDTVLELTRNNPDLAQRIRAVQTRSRELLGMSLQEYLLREGVLRPRRNAPEDSSALPGIKDLLTEFSCATEEQRPTDWRPDVSDLETAPSVVECSLSRASIRSEPVTENRATAVDGQAVEIHKIQYRYTPRLEVITMDGKHLGFLPASALRGITTMKRIKFGQGWDATLKIGAKGTLHVSFPQDLVMKQTPFPERTMRYNWDREDFDLSDCPIRDAAFSVQVHAGIYATACDDDIYRQYREFKANHAEELARQIILKDSKDYEEHEVENEVAGPEPFYTNESSLALLENIPLGTEFDVKIDTVYLDVPNGSRAAMHADDTERYAYPVPAFVLFHKGVRVANVPLVMQSDDKKTSFSAFWAFWKWSCEPTLKARAWLVNFYKPDVIWETDPTCTFAIGFFSGTERIGGELDLRQAWSYYRDPQDPLPVAQLMDLFGRTEKIDLSQYDANGDSKLYLKFQDGTGGTMPLGMFTVDLEETEDADEREWMTIDQVSESIDPPPPPEKSPFALITNDEFTQFVYVTGTHVGKRPQTCLRLKMGEQVKIVREPQNAYDSNAIAVCNTKGEQCGYVPANMARWIAPVMDAGIIKVKDARVEWATDWGQRTIVQLEITIFFSIDNTRFNVVAWRGDPASAPEIPFVVMGVDPENPDGLFLSDVYNRSRKMWNAGLAYCDEAFGVKSAPEDETQDDGPSLSDDSDDVKQKVRSKTGRDDYIVNMYVILTNEKKLGMLRRPQKEFCEIYQDDMPLLSKADIVNLRKAVLVELEDEELCVQYAKQFLKRPLEARFAMSTCNLFNVNEGVELDELAAWAIENTKEWYQESEYGKVRRLMDESLAEVRENADMELSRVNRAWTRFQAARKSLRIFLTDKESDTDIDPGARNFQLIVGSAFVDVRLRRDDTYNSCMVIDTLPWYWGVTPREIWDAALENEPRDLRDEPVDTEEVINQVAARVRQTYAAPSAEAHNTMSRQGSGM